MTLSQWPRHLRDYRALDRSDRRLFWAAWWRLLAAALRLQWRPRPTLAAALAPPRLAPVAVVAPMERATAAVLASAIRRAAAHHLRPMNCLPRALALESLLRAHGFSASLKIGVRKAGTGLAAHAWVELDGQPLAEPEAIAAEFLPLLPSAPPGP